MRLSPPRFLVFLIALALGVLGIVGQFTAIPFVSAYNFWFVAAGFALLVLGNLFRGL